MCLAVTRSEKNASAISYSRGDAMLRRLLFRKKLVESSCRVWRPIFSVRRGAVLTLRIGGLRIFPFGLFIYSPARISGRLAGVRGGLGRTVRRPVRSGLGGSVFLLRIGGLKIFPCGSFAYSPVLASEQHGRMLAEFGRVPLLSVLMVFVFLLTIGGLKISPSGSLMYSLALISGRLLVTLVPFGTAAVSGLVLGLLMLTPDPEDVSDVELEVRIGSVLDGVLGTRKLVLYLKTYPVSSS